MLVWMLIGIMGTLGGDTNEAPWVMCGKWKVPALDPPPSPLNTPGFKQCDMPPSWQHGPVVFGPDTWTQYLPEGAAWTKSGDTAGWALNPGWLYGCGDKAWCPYMCGEGMVEGQYDDSVGHPWHWASSCAGAFVYIGAGRRILPDDCAAKGQCAGGHQGLYCNNGTLEYKAPSTAKHGEKLCIPGPRKVTIRNTLSSPVAVCRKTLAGIIPMTYTTIQPNQTAVLAAPPAPINGVAQWYSADSGNGKTMGLQFFLSRLQEAGPTPCLKPACIWNHVRPACLGKPNSPGCTSGDLGTNSIGGSDYYPYILETWADDNGAGAFVTAAMLTNNDNVTGAPWTSYDRVLGSPGYKVRLVDATGKKHCDAHWMGPQPKGCERLCGGQGCADIEVHPHMYGADGHELPDNQACANSAKIDSPESLTFELYE